MFAISIVLFKLTLYAYLRGLNYEYLILFYILSSFVKVFWKSVSVKCTKNSFQNIRTDVKIRIFTILIAFWSGFGISKQNWENRNKIMIVGRSVYFYGALVQHPFPHRNPPPPPPNLKKYFETCKRGLRTRHIFLQCIDNITNHHSWYRKFNLSSIYNITLKKKLSNLFNDGTTISSQA